MDILEKAYLGTSGMTLDEIADQQLVEQEIEQAKQECQEIGEHFKRVIPSGGYDVCFNCGGKE